MMLLTPKPNLQRKPNTITIISQAKRTKIPEFDIIFDVDAFMVDDWKYPYVGSEPIIQNTLYATYEDFFVDLCSLLERLPVERGIVLVLLCDRGERLSVAAAELLARELMQTRNVEVYHKELEKWFKF